MAELLVPSRGYAVIGVNAAVSIICLGMMVLFYLRRDRQPIRSRLWWQSLTISMLNLIACFGFSMVAEFQLPYHVFVNILAVISTPTLLIVLRVAHIFSAYEVAGVYISSKTNELEGKLREGTIFVRRAKWIQSWRLQVALLCVNTVSLFAIFNGYYYIFPDAEALPEILVFAIVLSFYVPPAMFLAFNISTLKDGLFLKRELVVVTVLGGITGPSYILLRIFTNYYDGAWLLGWAPLSLIFIFVGFPLYKSYRWQSEARKRRRDPDSSSSDEIQDPSSYSQLVTNTSYDPSASGKSIDALEKPKKAKAVKTPGTKRRTLKNVLKDPEGLEVFLQFCKLELNHENVLFYRDAIKFLEDSKVKEEDIMQQVAHRLYERYIESGAPLQLNISAERLSDFTEQMTSLEGVQVSNFTEVLKSSLSEVFRLMNSDPFVRFVRSDLGKDYFEKSDYLAVV